MENIIITNQERFEKIKANIKKGGVENLQILADFDKTLTKAFFQGKPVNSLLAVLRDNNYFSLEYVQKAKAMSERYYPIEYDQNIPKEERIKLIEQWWHEHNKLLIEVGLDKKAVQWAAHHESIQFRDGFLDFMDFLKRNEIPLVVMSASGLGIEAIKMCFEKIDKLYRNVYIISNDFVWDENGKAITEKQPIIHSLNKDETLVANFPEIFAQVKNRKNVILLGDNPEDVAMVEGFEYENLIKIGFLNENIEENLGVYKQNFDVIITNDGGFEFINNLLLVCSKQIV